MANKIEVEVAAVAEFQPIYVQSLFDSLWIVPAIDGSVMYADSQVNVIADYNEEGASIDLDNGLSNKIITGIADDNIASMSGNNVVLSGAGSDYIQTGGGNDKIKAGSGDDFIDSGEGYDIISAGDGNDVITAWGDAVIDAGAGDDTIATDDGNDRISGGDGSDDISAWTGDDVVLGGAGGDFIDAGDGNDIITGGSGDDFIWGGEGVDTFVFDANDGSDIVYDFQIGDKIDASANATFVDNGGDDWTMTIGSTVVDVQVLGVTSIVFENGMWVGQ